MSAADILEIGDPMPRLASVETDGPTMVTVLWSEGPRAGNNERIDLAPDLLAYRIYRPLRADPVLFHTVHIAADGTAIAWGDNDGIDMPATALERLAEEQMSGADFSEFLARSKLTYEAAAASLGISRRLVGYYASGRPVPRHIALACRYLEAERRPEPGRRSR